MERAIILEHLARNDNLLSMKIFVKDDREQDAEEETSGTRYIIIPILIQLLSFTVRHNETISFSA